MNADEARKLAEKKIQDLSIESYLPQIEDKIRSVPVNQFVVMDPFRGLKANDGRSLDNMDHRERQVVVDKLVEKLKELGYKMTLCDGDRQSPDFWKLEF